MNEPNEPELLPCPFCGGKASFIYNDDEDCLYVKCRDCDIQSDPYFVDIDEEEIIYKEKSKQTWNRRTPPVPQWTTEPPKEGGFYVMHWRVTSIYDARFLDDDQFMEGQCMDEKIKDTEQMLSTLYPGALWLKLDVPPLPEWKEKKK